MREVLARDAADGAGPDVAHALGPLGRVLRHVLDERGERRRRRHLRVGPGLAVRAGLDRVDREAALERDIDTGSVERDGALPADVPDERLPRRGVAEVVAVRTDQVGRAGPRLEERDVEPFPRLEVQEDVDQAEQERRVGLRPDRHPLGGRGAGDREMRLDLHPLQPAHARLGVAPRARDAARRFGVRAEGQHVLRGRRVRADRERAMPQLPVEMLRVVALDALPAAEAEVDRAPRGEERRERLHVVGRRAAAAEARGNARVAGLVEQPLRAHLAEPRRHEVERLLPRDRDEARVVVAALARVGALQRASEAVRVVGLLHEAVGLDAALAAARVDRGGGEVRLDLGRHAVAHLHRQQVGARHALVAVLRNVADRGGHARRLRPPSPPSRRRARAASRPRRRTGRARRGSPPRRHRAPRRRT